MIPLKSSRVVKGSTEEKCKGYKFKEANYKEKIDKMRK